MDSLSSSGRSSTPVFDKVIRPSTDERVPPVDPHMPPTQNNRSFETNIPDTNSANNADLYGTLPRWKTQKSQDHVRQCNNQKLETEVYQDFLENQRRQTDNVNHSRSSSGARTPVNELNSDLINLPNGRYENSNQSQQQSVPSQYMSQVNRPYPDPKYTRMSQGLKPIPVTPPKIEKQSQHTEVGTFNQSASQLGAVSAMETCQYVSPSENDGSWQGNHEGFYIENNGEYLARQTAVTKPGSRAFSSTLARFIRTKSSKSVALPDPEPPRLLNAQVNKLDKVPVPPMYSHPPSSLKHRPGGRDRYQANTVPEKLNRSASFSIIRPAAYKQTDPRSGTHSTTNVTH